MRIKKKTGILMLTTAAVAATGVAAVSFAAWTGSNDTLTSHAATGEAYLFGFTDDQSTANLDLGTLVPYDQADGTFDSSAAKKIVSVNIPEYTVNKDYTITVTTDSTMSFYVLIGDEQTAAPAGAPTAWTDWKKADATGAEFSFTATTGTTVDSHYISLVLVSTDKADMNQSNIGFTVTLAEAAA